MNIFHCASNVPLYGVLAYQNELPTALSALNFFHVRTQLFICIAIFFFFF